MLIVDSIHSQWVRQVRPKLVSYDLRQSVDYKAINTYYMAIPYLLGKQCQATFSRPFHISIWNKAIQRPDRSNEEGIKSLACWLDSQRQNGGAFPVEYKVYKTKPILDMKYRQFMWIMKVNNMFSHEM